jgi:hypothetical protein
MATLVIDTCQGGLGDVWMRLAGLFTLAALDDRRSIVVRVSRNMTELAQSVFGSRLEITDRGGSSNYVYTSLGARSLIADMLAGRRYITPYSSFVSTDSRRHPVVNGLNQRVIRLFDTAKLVRSPRASDIHRYQGYTDIEPLARDRGVSYSSFIAAARSDFGLLRERLLHGWPRASASIGTESGQPTNTQVLIFPSGTSRQCMPSAWARANLPNAEYAFFYKDPLKLEYEQSGLRCRDFKESPAGMLSLIAQADWCMSTDSFASHLLQYYSARSTVLLTEVSAVRIVSPFYDGHIVPSLAACYPCRKTVRSAGSKCQAGHEDCINWADADYAQIALATIPSPAQIDAA